MMVNPRVCKCGSVVLLRQVYGKRANATYVQSVKKRMYAYEICYGSNIRSPSNSHSVVWTPSYYRPNKTGTCPVSMQPLAQQQNPSCFLLTSPQKPQHDNLPRPLQCQLLGAAPFLRISFSMPSTPPEFPGYSRVDSISTPSSTC